MAEFLVGMALSREPRSSTGTLIVFNLLCDGLEGEFLGVSTLEQAADGQVLDALHDILKVEARALLINKRTLKLFHVISDFQLVLGLGSEGIIEVDSEGIIEEVRSRGRDKGQLGELNIIATMLALVPTAIH